MQKVTTALLSAPETASPLVLDLCSEAYEEGWRKVVLSIAVFLCTNGSWV